MDKYYWEKMYRVLRDYGFSGFKAREIVVDAKRGDEYALSTCLLIAKLNEGAPCDSIT